MCPNPAVPSVGSANQREEYMVAAMQASGVSAADPLREEGRLPKFTKER
jgi:hypothetical protein